MSASDDYRALVMGKCPVGYWRLGEANDAMEARDETGRHRGKFLNAVSGPSRVTSVEGIFGNAAGDNRAIAFDGSNYLEVCNSPEFSQPTHNPYGMTVEAWLRPDKLDFPAHADRPYVHWMGKGNSDAEEWALRIYNDSDPTRLNRVSGYLFRPRKIAGQPKNLGAGAYFQEPMTAGEWMHVVVCYQPGDCLTQLDPRADPADHVSYTPGVEIYQNGVRMQGPPADATLYNYPEYRVEPAHGPQPLRIGARDLRTAYPYFIGAIDEVAIYPRLLTAAEIKDHYQTARPKGFAGEG